MMANRNEVYVESLLNVCVLDSAGKSIGRIEEIIALPSEGNYLVSEYHIGTPALMERFSAENIGFAILRYLGARKGSAGYRIPWNKLDLSNPLAPRITCSTDELSKL